MAGSLSTTLAQLTPQGRTAIMGIVNVTQDSFSDGGLWFSRDAAIEQGIRLWHAGADIIDVGAESTRPGATRVPEDLERARVSEVISALTNEGITTSVDTMRASTARAAAEAGVSLINDVSGGRADPEMYRTMAELDLPVCLMHWKTEDFGDAAGCADHGGDVVDDVIATFRMLVDDAVRAGVRAEHILLDPGCGFAKSEEDNWRIVSHLETFVNCGYPILLGVSRKRFLVALRGRYTNNHSAPVNEESKKALHRAADAATAAVSALAAAQGVWGVRVHDAASSRDAVEVVAAAKRYTACP